MATTGLRSLVGELRAPMELWAFFLFGPLVRALHVGGSHHSVLIIPGGFVDDGAMRLLRRAIAAQGYSVHGWGLGRNFGVDAETLAGLRARVEELYGEFEAPITVIGWSLGGLQARMLARDRPERIRQVITLGSPFRMVEEDQYPGALSPGRWKAMFKDWAEELADMRKHEHDRPPITVPTTAIYSRSDSLAPWQLCLDEVGRDAPNPRAENVEVHGTHLGFVVNPAALSVILDRLSQPRDTWHPFRPFPGFGFAYPEPATWTHPG